MSGTFPASSRAGSIFSLGDHFILIVYYCIVRNKFSVGQMPLTSWDLGDEMH